MLKIGVIRGGISTEREVSLKTGQEIINNLNKEKYEVFDIVIDNKSQVSEKISELKPDFVYIALHGKFGEDGRVQAILESFEIPYSGPGVMASALCMDKDLTKRVVSTYGVRTAKWLSVRKNETTTWDTIKQLGDRVIVKPNYGGSSVGVSFVENEEELSKALEEVYDIDNEAIIEEVLNGIEISVPIIGGEVYPTLLIEALAGSFFDYTSKYADGGAKETVFEFEKELQDEINDLTSKSYYATKCEGFARIDFMIVDKKPYMIEINTLPGMTGASLLPKSLASKGYNYSQALDLLIESSINVDRS